MREGADMTTLDEIRADANAKYPDPEQAVADRRVLLAMFLALREENEVLRKDAERYRWLFSHDDGKTSRVNRVWNQWDGASDWNAAVDAALATTKKKP